MSTPQGRTAMINVTHDFDMRVGKVVIYTVQATGFSIIAHRGGVACRGQMSLMKESGVTEFKKLFDRALIHHHHLAKSWDAGGSQTILSELIIDQKLNPILVAEG